MINSHNREVQPDRANLTTLSTIKSSYLHDKNSRFCTQPGMTTEGRQDPTEGSRASGEARPTFPSLGYRQPRETSRPDHPASPFSSGRGGARAGPLRPWRRARRHHQPRAAAQAATRLPGTHRPLAATLSATEPRSHRQTPGHRARPRPGRGYAAESPGLSKQESRPHPARGMPGRPRGAPRPRRVLGHRPRPCLLVPTGTTALARDGLGARAADACAPSLKG